MSLFTKLFNKDSETTEDVPTVPTDLAALATFDPDYVPSADEPGDIEEHGDVPDSEVTNV